jgi:hypothetical protein
LLGRLIGRRIRLGHLKAASKAGLVGAMVWEHQK